MSEIADWRARIAVALSTVDEITGHATWPTAPREGDAWPLIEAKDRSEFGQVFTTTWRLLLMLPSDPRTASQWVEEGKDEEIVDAIESRSLGYVQRISIEPIKLGTTEAAFLVFTMV